MGNPDIEAVLSGQRAYDSLDRASQALVRAEWDTRIDAARESLDLEAEFRAAKESWTEADADGVVVVRSD